MSSVTDDQIAALPGWFTRLDTKMFRLLLRESAEHPGSGDLAEMGAFLGKSAVLMGAYLGPDETFTVVDLFGGDASDVANQRENDEQYGRLTRAHFEKNYRAVHGGLPVAIQDFSSVITEHARHDRHRFVHIDASHLYEHVAKDIASSRDLLMTDGVVVLDDYRSEHTPGVSAAAWKAVAEGLHPFALTPTKMYATWGDSSHWRGVVESWLPTAGAAHERHAIGTNEVIRVWVERNRLVKYIPPAALPVAAKLRARIKR